MRELAPNLVEHQEVDIGQIRRWDQERYSGAREWQETRRRAEKYRKVKEYDPRPTNDGGES